MKKKALSLLLTFTTIACFADDTTLIDFAAFQYAVAETSKGCCEAKYPYAVLVDGEYIGDAKLTGNASQKLKYNDLEANALWAHKFNRHDGMTIALGYGRNYLHIQGNPYFNQTTYSSVLVGVMGFTDAISGWFWQAGVAGHFREPSGASLWQSSRFTSVLWGRYSYNDCLGIHIGTLLLTGIRKTNVWPILGFDYTWGKWTFDGILPVNLGVTYHFSKVWSTTVMGYPSLSRQRLNNQEPLPNGIWQYSNYGVQWGVNCRWKAFNCSLGVGYAFGGTVKIANANYDSPVYQSFNGSPYGSINCLLIW